MLSGGFQSSAYKQLLARQKQEDDERQVKLEELRKKKLREDIKRKRDEEDARKKVQLAKAQREQDSKQAKLDQEKAERKLALKREEEERKRPLTVDEAKKRREEAEAIRNKDGISRSRQVLPSSNKVLSTKYSSLLATAATKLDAIPPTRRKSPGTGPTNGGQKPVLAQIAKRTLSPLKVSSASDRVQMTGPAIKAASDVFERRASPFLNNKLPPTSTRKQQSAEFANLQPLQKTKRDLRSIEEIQNDLHRRNGKNYAHLSQPKTADSPVKKATSNQSRPVAPVKTSSNPTPKSKTSSGNTIPRQREMKQSRRRRRDSYDSEDSFVSQDAQRDNGLGGGESIWDILNPGKKRDAYLARDIDSDEDMEANAEDIRREEQRASKAAKLEDEREATLLREKEARKAAAKKRRLASS